MDLKSKLIMVLLILPVISVSVVAFASLGPVNEAVSGTIVTSAPEVLMGTPVGIPDLQFPIPIPLFCATWLIMGIGGLIAVAVGASGLHDVECVSDAATNSTDAISGYCCPRGHAIAIDNFTNCVSTAHAESDCPSEMALYCEAGFHRRTFAPGRYVAVTCAGVGAFLFSILGSIYLCCKAQPNINRFIRSFSEIPMAQEDSRGPTAPPTGYIGPSDSRQPT